MVTPAGPGDALALAQVHVRAWRETYPGMLPQAYLDRMSPEAHAARWAWRRMHSAEVTLAAEGRDGLWATLPARPWAGAGPVAGKPRSPPSTSFAAPSGEGVGRRLLTGMARTLAAQGATSLILSGLLRDNLLARGSRGRWEAC